MHRFFAATGRFAVRFRWAVVAAWVAAAVLANLFLPSLASVTRQSNTDMLPAGSPSLRAARLATPFQGPNQTPVSVVIARRTGPLRLQKTLASISRSRSSLADSDITVLLSLSLACGRRAGALLSGHADAAVDGQPLAGDRA